jgi:hypothetical protein
MKPPINTFEDLVASENIELILLADTITKKRILASFCYRRHQTFFLLALPLYSFKFWFWFANFISHSGCYTWCTKATRRWYSRTSWSNIEQHRESERSLENWTLCFCKCKWKSAQVDDEKTLLILQILYQPQSFCDNFVASQFQDKGNCRFKTTDSYSMTMYFSMPLQKNSEYTPIFKDA